MVTLINNVPCRYVHKYDTEVEFILLHKILDNGAFELGSSLNPGILLDWAEKLNVDEVIAPDKFKDKYDTLTKTGIFLTSCPKKYKIQVVPQGNNEKELIQCLEQMLTTYPDIDVIGFNKLWDRHSLRFKKILEYVYTQGKEIHLLGVNNLKDWVSIYNNPYIRSADSRVLTKIVSGKEDTWEVVLTNNQQQILERLHKEVMLWQK